MGRPRGFDEQQVVDAAAALFTAHGYEATSIDDLVGVTGLHRGSLYKAFGSKRGMFLAALQRLVQDGSSDGHTATADRAGTDRLDLLLVAALELAPHDPGVRDLVRRGCAGLGEDMPAAAALLGRRLLHRAGALAPVPLQQEDSPWHA